MSKYRCIECGCDVAHLYTQLKAGITKVSFCESCGALSDKYIVCDPVILLLDALLHKPQVYRHLLFNGTMQALWKLFLIFLLCDTYLKWDNLHGRPSSESSSGKNPIFYAAMELDFYRMSIVALVEWLVFMFIIVAVFHFFTATHTISHSGVMHSIIISSFGKLLAVPAVIWGQTHSDVYLWLTQLFVITSNISALKVMSGVGRAQAACVVLVAYASQYYTGAYIKQFVMS